MSHLLTSVVREICTLRSVGAEARATALGHPVGITRVTSYRDLFITELRADKGPKGTTPAY